MKKARHLGGFHAYYLRGHKRRRLTKSAPPVPSPTPERVRVHARIRRVIERPPFYFVDDETDA